jgi:two-component system cell cycle response regulator
MTMLAPLLEDLPPTVLVVDDARDVRTLVRLELELSGVRVVEAGKGDDALRLLSEEMVDVVLLDVDIPVLDGYQVMARVQADPRLSEVPVVFLTAQDAPDDVIRALALGAHDHIAKPFHSSELRARVEGAVRVKRLQDQLRASNRRLLEESRTDILTRLPNRRRIEEELQRVASASKRHGTEYTVVVVDIDRFKTVNDTWGHAAGDEVLRTVASLLTATLRTEDAVGRWGGEEFLFVLPMTPLDGGLALMDRVRRLLAASPVSVAPGEEVTVTISAGIASGVGDFLPVVTAADDAVYAAKAAGRDCVHVADQST